MALTRENDEDTQMTAVTSLLYGSKSWGSRKEDFRFTETMRFLQSVEGYTRFERMRSQEFGA